MRNSNVDIAQELHRRIAHFKSKTGKNPQRILLGDRKAKELTTYAESLQLVKDERYKGCFKFCDIPITIYEADATHVQVE